MLAGVAYICGGTQYQFEHVSSRQVLFNTSLVIFHACSFHDKVHDTSITRYKEAWSTQTRNGMHCGFLVAPRVDTCVTVKL